MSFHSFFKVWSFLLFFRNKKTGRGNKEELNGKGIEGKILESEVNNEYPPDIALQKDRDTLENFKSIFATKNIVKSTVKLRSNLLICISMY